MSLVPADATTVLANRESSAKTASTGAKSWLTVQPNPGGIQGFRAAYESVSRNILSKNLTPEAGDIVGMSVQPRLVVDVTKDHLDFYAGDMYRCTPKHGGSSGQSFWRASATVDGGGSADSITVPADGDVAARSLIRLRGAVNAANNAVFVAEAGSTDTSIKVPTGTLVAETLPANAVASFVGFEGALSDITMEADGDLSATTENFTTWGLQPGQIIRIGDSVANSFFAADKTGFAEVDPTRTITATFLPLRNHSFTPGADPGTGKKIRILFSRFLRNYPLGHASFSKLTSQLEMEQPGAGTGDVSSFRYAKGLRVGNFEIDAQLKSKIVLTLGFIGLDMPDPVLQASRPADTATALEPLQAAIFDTTSDYKHLRLAVAAGNTELNGENSHIQSWTLSQDLNLSPVEIHGVLGAKDHTDGSMMPVVSFNAYLASDELVKKIKANTNVRFCPILGNEDGGWALNIPYGKLRADDEAMAAGEGTMISFELAANREPVSGIVSSLSVFDYLP